jgi:hypothetical protein
MSEPQLFDGGQFASPEHERPTKKCIACAESILDEATRCKHCGAEQEPVDVYGDYFVRLLILGAMGFGFLWLFNKLVIDNMF